MVKHNYQELYDQFYDYVGQDLFNRIKYGQQISKEELEEWDYKTIDDFLMNWRGNSDDEFQKWLKEKEARRFSMMEVFLCNSCDCIFKGDSSDDKDLFCPNDNCEDPSDYVFLKFDCIESR